MKNRLILFLVLINLKYKHIKIILLICEITNKLLTNYRESFNINIK